MPDSLEKLLRSAIPSGAQVIKHVRHNAISEFVVTLLQRGRQEAFDRCCLIKVSDISLRFSDGFAVLLPLTPRGPGHSSIFAT